MSSTHEFSQRRDSNDYGWCGGILEPLEPRLLLSVNPMVIQQVELGNVFEAGQAVRVNIQTECDSVDWSVIDFYGSVVQSGTTAVSGGTTAIQPGTANKGWYQLHINGKVGSVIEDQADTTFAILAPVDVANMDDSPFGVMTHFAQGWNTDIVDLIAKAGIVHARDEQYWATIEQSEGVYNFPTSYTNYMDALAANDINITMEMDFANILYDTYVDTNGVTKAATPYTEEGRQAYAAYCQALLDQYGAQIQTAEIWNEYNGSFAVGPATADRPHYYTEMLKDAYTQIKSTRADVDVIGGAAVLIPLGYFDEMFDEDALNYMDGIAVHPYRAVPEGVEKELAALTELMDSYGEPVPIWATESGGGRDATLGRQEMSRYLVRLFTLMSTQDVERMYWYLMRDYHDFTTGLVYKDNSSLGRYAPASPYAAYSNLIQQLYQADYVDRDATDLRTRIYRFDKAGQQLRVAWSTDGQTEVIFSAPGPLTVVDIMGAEQVYTPVNGRVQLTLGENPIYIKGTVTAIQEQRPDILIADSTFDFGSQQGADGWSYGHYDGDGTGSGDGGGVVGAYSDDDFEQMTWTLQEYGFKWTGPYSYNELTERAGHPSNTSGRQVWAVRRWVSDVAGTVHLTGELTRGSDNGDGTFGKILLNGSEIYSQLVNPSNKSVTYDIEVTLAVGDILDFAITPGTSTNISYDATTFTAGVKATPAPTGDVEVMLSFEEAAPTGTVTQADVNPTTKEVTRMAFAPSGGQDGIGYKVYMPSFSGAETFSAGMGVTSANGGNFPNQYLHADGTQDAAAQGFAIRSAPIGEYFRLELAPLDVASSNATLTFQLSMIGDPGYEASDFFRVLATDSGGTVTLMNWGEPDLESQRATFAGDVTPSDWKQYSFDLGAAGLSGTTTVAFEWGIDGGTENIFLDNVSIVTQAAPPVSQTTSTSFEESAPTGTVTQADVNAATKEIERMAFAPSGEQNELGYRVYMPSFSGAETFSVGMGVTSSNGGNFPNQYLYADGTQDAAAQGFALRTAPVGEYFRLEFDPVDISAMGSSATLSFSLSMIGDPGYEASDFLRVIATDAGGSVTLMDWHEQELESQRSTFAGDVTPSDWKDYSFDLSAAGLSGAVTIAFEWSMDGGTENIFLDNVEFSANQVLASQFASAISTTAATTSSASPDQVLDDGIESDPQYIAMIRSYKWLRERSFLKRTSGNAHPSAEDGKPDWAVRLWQSGVEDGTGETEQTSMSWQATT